MQSSSLQNGITGGCEIIGLISYSNTDIALLQCTGIIESVAYHGYFFPLCLKRLDVFQLVIGILVKVKGYLLVEHFLQVCFFFVVVAAQYMNGFVLLQQLMDHLKDTLAVGLLQLESSLVQSIDADVHRAALCLHDIRKPSLITNKIHPAHPDCAVAHHRFNAFPCNFPVLINGRKPVVLFPFIPRCNAFTQWVSRL